MSDFVRERLFTANGLRLHVREWGDEAGRSIVLLHGIRSNARVWDAFARELGGTGKWRVIVPDLRGHGESAWASEYGIPRYVDDLVALTDAMDLSSFPLVGLSLGGRIAYSYAAANPEPVERLVITDIGPPRSSAAVTPGVSSAAQDEGFIEPEDAIALSASSYPLTPVAALREHVAYSLLKRDDGRWTWRHDPAVQRPASSAQAPDVEWALLRRVMCPTLLIRGSESKTLARGTAERMVREIPHCELTEIEGSGHLVPLDKPEAFAAATSSFLER